MAHFTKGGTAKTPFGKNVYLRSTQGCLFESYSFACNSFLPRTIDGVAGQKILQPGTFIAKITSGPDTGKVGVYEPAGTAEVQTLTESGTITGGTYTLVYDGLTTANIAFNATAAAVQAALEALANVEPGEIVVTGGPVDTTPLTLTFAGGKQGNQPQITANVGNLTGTTPGITAATTTPGVAGSIDGRGTSANIVGILDTFLPWHLMERDVEVAVLYHGAVVAANCIVYAAGQATSAAPDGTQQGFVRSVAGMDILFH